MPKPNESHPSLSQLITRRAFIRTALVAGASMALAPTALLAAADGRVRYKVKRGDTLSEIAQAHGVSVSALKRENGLKRDLIRIGQVLVIPEAVGSTKALAPVIAATKGIRVNRNRWQYVVAHHSAIEQGNAKIYGRTHKRRGMENGLAYHFVIGNGIDSGDGEIEVGPRWLQQLRGGHVRDTHVNDVGIGICMVGNFENHPPTAAQHRSFVALVDYLRDGYVAKDYTFTVHRWVDRNHTLCPGKHFPYDEMKRRYRG